MSIYLEKQFRYQVWANGEFLDCLSRLDPQAMALPLEMCLRLLNHTYVVSQIFAAHLTGRRHCYASDNTDETPAIDDLRANIAASDSWYLDFIRTLSSKQLAESIAFSFTDGDKGLMSREEMLLHVVLHGTVHRGEIGRILMQNKVMPPWDTLAVYLHQTEPERRHQQVRIRQAG